MNADNDEYKNGARVMNNSRPIAYGGTYRIRTCDLWFRRPVLYPTELMPQSNDSQRGNGGPSLQILPKSIAAFGADKVGNVQGQGPLESNG